MSSAKTRTEAAGAGDTSQPERSTTLGDSVAVRLANRDDAPAITSVINAAFRQAEGFFVAEDRIDLRGVVDLLSSGAFLLSEKDESLLGCVYIELPTDRSSGNCERAYLGLLSVDPERQQSGLGSFLMEAAEDYAKGLGATSMDIKVVSVREELFGFYRRRGYVETGTSPFPDEVETKVPCHFVEMTKPLNKPES